MQKTLKREWNEFHLLLKNVPTVLTGLFFLAVFSMNLLANKSISLPVSWLALDCGIVVSWFVFFAMDIITKHYGPKAATQLSILATLFNLVFCLLLFIGSKIPGVWAEASAGEGVNGALDKTFGGTWYVVMGSTVAFLASSIINNFSNWGIGKAFKKNPDGMTAFVLRTYVSTAVGQFADNFIFALIVSHFFFGWTMVQCLTCAAAGMLFELICEGLFFYPAYYICKKWKERGVGAEYLALKKGEEHENSCDGNE